MLRCFPFSSEDKNGFSVMQKKVLSFPVVVAVAPNCFIEPKGSEINNPTIRVPVQIKINFSSDCWSFSPSEFSSDSDVLSISISLNCLSKASMAALDALLFLRVSVEKRLNGEDKSTDFDFHDRVDSSADELPPLKAFRNLSTNRLWNLFKLF